MCIWIEPIVGDGETTMAINIITETECEERETNVPRGKRAIFMVYSTTRIDRLPAVLYSARRNASGFVSRLEYTSVLFSHDPVQTQIKTVSVLTRSQDRIFFSRKLLAPTVSTARSDPT